MPGMYGRWLYSSPAPEASRSPDLSSVRRMQGQGTCCRQLMGWMSQINGCAYCLDQHTRVLQKKGVKVEKLALVQVWREAEVLFD